MARTILPALKFPTKQCMTQAQPSPATAPVRWLRPALAGVLLLAVGTFYTLGWHRQLSWEALRANLDAWETQVQANLPRALLVFFLIYVAVTALSVPVAAPLTLVGGALFGRWLATAVVSVAATSGATLAFLASRYLFRDWVQRRFGQRLQAINRGVERDGAYYLFTLRLLPVVPFWLINLGMGLTPLPARTFAAVSWLGMLLGTFLYANVGRELRQLDSPAGVVSPTLLASLALLGLVPLLLRLVLRRSSR